MPQLVEHVTMVHDKQGECPECGKVLSSKATLAFHLQSVHNEEEQKNPMSMSKNVSTSCLPLALISITARLMKLAPGLATELLLTSLKRGG